MRASLEALPLTESQQAFLRQLFKEGYTERGFRNIRWLRGDLYNSYETSVGSLTDFSHDLDELAAGGYMGLRKAPSGHLVEYFLHRKAIDELAANRSPVDSTAWTGLAKTGALTSVGAAAVAAAAKEAELKLSSFEASNTDKAQMHAYLVAIRHLAEAPEPPADLIWTLISRAADITQLAMLVAVLTQLFT